MDQPAPQDSVLQFGLRALLFLTAGPAVFCAALGPRLRAWESAQLAHIAAFVTAALLVWAGTMAVICWQRRRAERTLGRLLLRVKSTRWWLVGFYGGLVAVAATFTFLLAAFIEGWTEDANFSAAFLWTSLPVAVALTGAPMTAGLALWWGPDAWRLEVRRHGLLLLGTHRFGWNEVSAYHWDPLRPGRLRLRIGRTYYHFTIVPNQRGALDKRLAEHVPSEA